MGDLEPRVISSPDAMIVQREHTVSVLPVAIFISLSPATRGVPQLGLDSRLKIPRDIIWIRVEMSALDIWRFQIGMGWVRGRRWCILLVVCILVSLALFPHR